MRFLGLDAESVAARVAAEGKPARVLSMGQSISRATIGFTLASLVVFGSWAFAGQWMYETLGGLGAYGGWTVLFVGVAGGTLSSVLIGPQRKRRFYPVFTLAFFLYAAAWTAAWYTSKNKTGEILGAVLGPLLLVLVFCAVFQSWNSIGPILIVVWLCHGAGYFLGDWIYANIHSRTGMLLWGLAYGIGYGAGLGYALHRCQDRTRRRLIGEPGRVSRGGAEGAEREG
jgi:hypothetical protein